MLENRWMLSAATQVGIGAPLLVPFYDPNATASTTFTANSSSADLGATVLQTPQMLQITAHTVNANGTVGTSGTMDILLLQQYAPNNIAHIVSLVDSGFYNGLEFFRVISDFMQQFGDPSNNGSGSSNTIKVDDELSADLRFDAPGLLAMANSGPNTNDCQFFLMNAPYPSLDFGYTIIGDLVSGDSLRQAISEVPVTTNSSGEDSLPLNPPIVDSMTVVPDTQYGLVMLKPGSAATAGETANVTITASNGTAVTLTASDGSSTPTLNVEMISFTPSTSDNPAFIDPVPDVTTTMNTPATFSIPVTQGDPGVALQIAAQVVSTTSDLSVSATGNSSTNATATVTPSNNLLGVYDVILGEWRSGTTPGNGVPYDTQDVAVYIDPTAPGAVSLATAGLSNGGTTTLTTGLDFDVSGCTSGVTVGIFADGGTTPIGTATANAEGAADIVTNVALSSGAHTLVAKQLYAYDATTVGNSSIAAGTLYSDASANSISLTVTSGVSATLSSGPTESSSQLAFGVTYTGLNGGLVSSSTIDDNNIKVTGPDGFSQFATLVSLTPNGNGATLVADYAVNAPGGTWTSTYAGAYTITLEPNQVGNTSGGYAPTTVLATYNVVAITPIGVTIAPASGQTDLTNNATVDLTVTFAQAVTGFTSSDVVLSGAAGATTAVVSGSGTTYNIAITGMSHYGAVVASIDAGVVHDAAGNANTAASNSSVSYTPLGETVAAAAAQHNPTNASPINFTVVFTKPVTGFAGSDVTMSGTAVGTGTTATVTPVTTAGTTAGTTYTVAVSGMTGNGTVSVAVPASAVHDATSDPNAASAAASVTYNATPPSVTIVAATGQTSPTASSPIDFTVTFSEAVTGFTSGSDVDLSGSTATGTLAATITPVTTAGTTAGTTYTVAVSGMTGPGTVSATIDAGKVDDAAGNANLAATTPATVTYSPLSVTVNRATGQAATTNASTIDFTVTFSEPVTDFTSSSDVDLSASTATGTLAATITPVGTAGTTYTVAVSGMTGYGTVVASVDAGAVTGAAGNPNVASTGTSNTVTYEVAPTVTIVPAASQAAATGSGPIDFTVTFSEPVTDFTSGSDVDLNASTVSGTLAATITPVTTAGTTAGTTYTVAVSGMTGIGTVSATIDAGVVKDAVGDANVAATTPASVTYSPLTETVAVATGQVNPTVASPINFTVTFNQAPTSFTASDVNLSGTAVGLATSATVTAVSGSTTAYTVAVSGMIGNGTVVATVPAGVVTDADGVANTASVNTDDSVTYITRPSIQFSPASGSTVNTSTIDFYVHFSDAVTDFNSSSDVVLSGTAGPTTAVITPSGTGGTTYEVAVSGMTGNGTVTLSVPANVAHDLAHNGNLAASDTINYNTTGPSVTVVSASGTASNSATINYTVTFSESVSDFVTGDVTLSGTADASTATVSGSGATYNVAVSGMTKDGTVIVSVAAGVAHDAAGNPNTAAPSPATVTYNTEAPTATIALASGQATVTHDMTVNYVVTFSEAVTGFGAGSAAGVDGMVVGGTAFGTTATPTVTVTASGAGGEVYDVAVSGMTKDGTIIASVASGAASDAAGNQNSPSPNAPTVTLQTTGPTVTIAPVAGQTPTATGTLEFTATFSEPVTGFTTGKVTLSGTAGATTAVISGSGATYNIAVSGMQQTGTVILSIGSGAVHDAANNGNQAYTATYTTVGPTVTVAPASGQAAVTTGSTIEFTVTFSEPVTGFGTGSVTLGGTAGATTKVVSGSGTTYNVAVSGMTRGGTVIATIAAGAARDALGFGNVASSGSVTYSPLSATITAPTSLTNHATIDFTVVFSEPVSGFGTGGVTLGGTAGPTTAVVSGSGTTYNVAVSGMTSDGTVTATVAAGAAKDAAGNPNAPPAGPASVTYDTAAPNVVISLASGQASATNDSTINFEVDFSQAVTAFTGSDVDLKGGTATGTLTALVTPIGTDGTSYNVAVSGMIGDGTVIATIDAGKVEDAAGNLNTAAPSSVTVTYNTVGPDATIVPAAGQATTTGNSPINFTCTFTEPVTNFTGSDVDLSASTAAGTLSATVTQVGIETYTVGVSGMTGAGTVVASIDAGVVRDAAGNANFASTNTGNSVTYSPLGVTITPPSTSSGLATSSPVDYTVTFTEPVTGFNKSDVTLQSLQYRLTDLGVLSGDSISEATAINNAGQVSGYSATAASTSSTGSSTQTYQAFLYSGGQLIDLGTLGGGDSQALGLDNAGQVIGLSSLDQGNSTSRAFLYSGGELIDLGTIGGDDSQAYAINSAGQVVGTSTINSEDQVSQAFLYSGGTLTDLGLLNTTDTTSVALGINASGQVVGYSANSAANSGSGEETAFLYTPGSGMTSLTPDLGLSSGYNSIAAVINASGEIGGSYWQGSNSSATTAYLYNGQVTTLAGLGGSSTYIYGLNSSGDAVGDSTTASGTTDAFVYNGTTMTDLNDLLGPSGAGWVLTDAKGINDSGVIVGTGTDAAGQQHAYMLTPVSVAPNAVVTVTPIANTTSGQIDGTTYQVSISGMTGAGQLSLSVAGGVVHDASGNANAASPASGNTVNYHLSGPAVTISPATGQANPTGQSPVNFTVSFSDGVTSFTAGDISFAGSTAQGTLTATVTAVSGSTTQYTVAVSGMIGSGAVTINVPAGDVTDALGNANTAYSGTGNTVNFALAHTATIALTEPVSGSYNIGQSVAIAWSGTNVISGEMISLYYSSSPQWNAGSEHLIATTSAAVTTPAGGSVGYGVYNWAVPSMPSGTYYISGELNASGQISSIATPITILGPSLKLLTPTPTSYTAGDSVNVGWIAAGVPASGGATVTLYYATSASGQNEVLIGSQPITVNGADMYTWNTAEVPGGTYYIAATLTSGGTTVGPYYTKAINVAGPADPTTPTSGPNISAVGVFVANGYISWNAADANGVSGGQLSIDGKSLGASAISGPYAAAAGVNYAGIFSTLSAGVHSYLITATNRYGIATVASGSFTVPGTSVAGPTISQVGINFATDSISWNEADADGVAGGQLAIDGQTLGPSAVSGPYATASGVNYAGMFGGLAAGTYTYTITATDNQGYTSQQSGQLVVPAGSANSANSGSETPAELARAAIRTAALDALTSLASQSGKVGWGYT